MTDCEHKSFRANASIGRIMSGDDGPVTQFVCDLTILCTECGESFGFRGVRGGHSWNEPRCQLDAKTISLPLMSPAELELAGPLPVLQRGEVNYEVYPTELDYGEDSLSLDELHRRIELFEAGLVLTRQAIEAHGSNA